MLKRLCLALAGLFCVVGIAQGAGTVPGFSLTPQFDLSGKLVPGCKLAVIQAGTTATPQVAYQDSALTIPSPGGANLVCDAAGRLPQFFVADGLIKLRLTDKNGLQIFVGDNLLVVGPSSGGGGGGGTVDPTTILATGDIKNVYGTGVLSGFVRANGRSIGSATSGATERANADTSALFAFLWNQDANLVVSGGRGASAAADFAANKTLTLPDFRGRIMAALGDMGNADLGLLSPAYFGASGTTLGAIGGGQNTTLTLAQAPTGITSSGAISGTAALAGSFIITQGVAGVLVNSQGGSGSTAPQIGTAAQTPSLTLSGTSSVTSNNTGGAPHRTVQPTILITTYIKL